MRGAICGASQSRSDPQWPAPPFGTRCCQCQTAPGPGGEAGISGGGGSSDMRSRMQIEINGGGSGMIGTMQVEGLLRGAWYQDDQHW